MKISEIDNIDLQYLRFEDYLEIKEAMQEVYASMPDSYWKEHHIQALLEKFPEGQVVIKVNGQIAGCALSIIVDYSQFDDHHTYKEVTADYTFDSHNPDGMYYTELMSLLPQCSAAFDWAAGSMTIAKNCVRN